MSRIGLWIALAISALIVLLTVRADATMALRASLTQVSPPKKCAHMYRWSWQWNRCIRAAIHRSPDI
jgi:hypothetical protein